MEKTKQTLFDLTDEQLQIEAALEEAGGELTPELEQAMGANCEALATKVDGYNAILRKADLQTDAIDAEIKRLQDLKRSKQNAVKSLKAYLLWVMQTQGIERLEGTLCKISRRKTKSVEIYDEALLLKGVQGAVDELNAKLPAWCSVDLKVSKTEIKRAIEGGVPMQGARMADGESLIVK